MSTNGGSGDFVPSVRLPTATTSINQQKHPCVMCQKRKVKCDRNYPCGNCKKAAAECISPASLPPRTRKKRFPEAELLARLRRYERHLRSYGADIDAINREDVSPATVSTAAMKADFPEPLPPHPKPLSVRRSLKNVENNLWVGVSEEFRDAEEMLQGSSDDDDFDTPSIVKIYDSMDDKGGDLLLGTPQVEDLRQLHPSPIHIFRLWQFYLDNVNPLTKIFHSPSIQQQILDATSDLKKVPRNTEALMFGIYSMAVTSLNDEECRNVFGEERTSLFSRYQSGARQALINAGYLKSSDIVVLQAFTLYLLSSMQQLTMDPRSLFCLTGIAVRIAQRLGLSYDGTVYGLVPIEVEVRRRLWWQIILIDTRVAEFSGAGPTLLTYSWQTSIPGNINDSDLSPDTRDPPVERPGITEALFVRLRAEFLQITSQIKASSESFKVKEMKIGDFEQRIQREYLSYCDPSIPFHLMSIMFARLAYYKLRLGLRHPHLMAKRGEIMSSEEKESLFVLCLDILEYHNLALSTTSIQQFVWQFQTNFPFPAIVYLTCSLRFRAPDALADKAWLLLEAIQNRREMRDSKNFQQRRAGALYAMANLTLKAWEVREAALSQFQRNVPVPNIIVKMRETIAKRKSESPSVGDNSSTPSSLEEGPGYSAGDQQFFDQKFAGLDQTFAPTLLPGSLPIDTSDDWMFWNGVIQGNGSIPGFDGMVPQHF